MNEQQLADLFSEQIDLILAGNKPVPTTETGELQELLELGQQFTQINFQVSVAGQAAFQNQLTTWFGPNSVPVSPIMGMSKVWITGFILAAIAIGTGITLAFLTIPSLSNLRFNADEVPGIELKITPDKKPTLTPNVLEMINPAASATPDDTPVENTGSIEDKVPAAPSSLQDVIPIVTSSVGDTIPLATSSLEDTIVLPTVKPVATAITTTVTTGDDPNDIEGVGGTTQDENGGDDSDSNTSSGTTTTDEEHDDRGHGNDPDGIDEDNPGQSSGSQAGGIDNLTGGSGGGASGGGQGNNGNQGNSGGKGGGKGNGKGK